MADLLLGILLLLLSLVVLELDYLPEGLEFIARILGMAGILLIIVNTVLLITGYYLT